MGRTKSKNIFNLFVYILISKIVGSSIVFFPPPICDGSKLIINRCSAIHQKLRFGDDNSEFEREREEGQAWRWEGFR